MWGVFSRAGVPAPCSPRWPVAGVASAPLGAVGAHTGWKKKKEEKKNKTPGRDIKETQCLEKEDSDEVQGKRAG